MMFYVTQPRCPLTEDFDWSASSFWSDALPVTSYVSFVDALRLQAERFIHY
jgi:hypothetical protein